MEQISKTFALLGIVFMLLAILFNLWGRLPRIPGDIYIDRPGIKIYIPWLSAIILSVILTIALNFFHK